MSGEDFSSLIPARENFDSLIPACEDFVSLSPVGEDFVSPSPVGEDFVPPSPVGEDLVSLSPVFRDDFDSLSPVSSCDDFDSLISRDDVDSQGVIEPFHEMALQVDDVADEKKWWLDSGCSNHMTGAETDLNNFVPTAPVDVYLADKSVVPAIGKGNLNIILYDENGEKVPITFTNVMLVPKLKNRLISISQLTDQDAEVTFKKKQCTLKYGERTFIFGHKVGKLYGLSNVGFASCNFSASDSGTSLSIWHQRFAHLNQQDLKRLASSGMVEGMSIVDSDPSNAKCEGCLLGKQCRNPFPKKSSSKTTEVLELIHSDVCGPMSVPSLGGSTYFVSFIDDFSRHCWVYVIKRKSEAFDKFKEFKALTENQTGKRVKRIRDDNGGEYFSKEFDEFCKENGVFREPTIPYTPQQNGVAERMNRTIMDNVRALLYHGGLPLYLWAEAVPTVVYLRNRSPTSSIQGVTPYERFTNTKPNVSHLRVFGCIAYAKVPDEKRQKLDPKSVKGVFVGYPVGSKGYKIFLPDSRKMIRCRDVQFIEDSFAAQLRNDQDEPVELLINPEYFYEPHDRRVHFNDDVDTVVIHDTVEEPEVTNDVVGGADNRDAAADADETVAERSFENDNDVDGGFDDILPDLSRPMRVRKDPDRYGEWASIAETNPDPRTYKQAVSSAESSRWKAAMTEEYNSLTSHQTWELVDLPEGKNLVGCKWVYKTKRNAFGEIDRFKARLVAQGFSQQHGVDFDEVFAPVARYKSIRSLLAVANQLDMEVHQMDVVSAFLNGKLEEEIYMKQPEGFVDQNNSDKVCRLKASLYGLKQSARCWNTVMDSYLKSEGYIQSTADPCIYYKSCIIDGEKCIILIGVYVDDTILCCNNLDFLKAEKSKISGRFEMDDRGEISSILGMAVTRDRKNRTLTISQKVYLEEVLARFGMQNCKPISTPLETGKNFCKVVGVDGDEVDERMYQAAIGSLNYAAIATRPDISAAVGKLSQFMKNPRKEHWVGVKRILRYIRGTLDFGLRFCAKDSDDFVLLGYSDSDWAGCVDSRKSTSGQIFLLGGCAISWRSKKQSIVALSSTEAEYVALCEAAQETIWLRNLLHDIGLIQEQPTVVFEDNQGALALAHNPRDHPRTKHMDVKYHFIRDTIERKRMSVAYCRTNQMVADTFTKGLAKPAFEKLRRAMGVESCCV